MAFPANFIVWVLLFFAVDVFFLLVMSEEALQTLENVTEFIPSQNPPSSSSSSSSSPISSPNSNIIPFRPSIAVIIGVLTTMFSITFLILLYAKHCKRNGNLNQASPFQISSFRRNSGVDRVIIESLPIFRFGSLQGQKEGLECAVCLTRFEPPELLRLLPKCNHAFHVECVDTWLDAHSTCPLCRYRVDPDDVLVTVENPTDPSGKSRSEVETETDPPTGRSIGFQEVVSLGCFDKDRKDSGLPTDLDRFEHRIVISDSGSGPVQQQRWSDLKPSDFFLRSEMIISDSRRYSMPRRREDVSDDVSGRSVINSRCQSEITGLSRFRRDEIAKRWVGFQPRPPIHGSNGPKLEPTKK